MISNKARTHFGRRKRPKTIADDIAAAVGSLPANPYSASLNLEWFGDSVPLVQAVSSPFTVDVWTTTNAKNVTLTDNKDISVASADHAGLYEVSFNMEASSTLDSDLVVAFNIDGVQTRYRSTKLISTVKNTVDAKFDIRLESGEVLDVAFLWTAGDLTYSTPVLRLHKIAD